MTGPRVHITPRRTYAEVVVDLWPCDYNLTAAGQDACRELLAAAQPTGRRRPGYFSAGPSIVQTTAVKRDQAQALADSIVAIVTDPRYQDPVRFP